MKETIIKVQGMACEGCEKRIQNALKNMEGIENVVANHKEGTVAVKVNEIDIDKVKERIKDLGFTVL
ncbi:MAG: heavy-metal-associated domain-containing protein [Clostridia bacterium]|nr:heavy-metal-associated domain-containing protein [Clostridia bacterium]